MLKHGAISNKKKHLWISLVLLSSLLAFGPAGCDVIEDFLNESSLSGQNAYVHLQRADDRAPTTNIQAVMKVMELRGTKGDTTSSVDTFEPGDDAINLMRKTARSRRNIKTADFTRIPFPAPKRAKDPNRPKDASLFPPPDLSSLQSEYTIPGVDRIPVRDQAYRGTCAAFAGIGQLEYSAVKQYGLSTLDLSEQRFYFNSKPECQSGSCGQGDEGSWYGTGMDASIASSGLDIPLESDCPYVSDFVSNDVQAPQSASCSTGAAKVDQTSVVYTPQEIIDMLNQGYAVPFASPLSGNWESNTGLITLAESGFDGNTSHAGGHAYLIVGYRLLPNLPDEGGMCFIIKNSWGSGWGVNGYSCMTLAWVQNWHFGEAYDHPVATSISLRQDVIDANGGGGGGTWDGGGTNDDTVDNDTDDGTIPDPVPSDLTWTRTYLFGPDDYFYRGETASDANNFYVRGILADGRNTNAVTLQLNGQEILFEGEVVGRTAGDEVTLCTAEFDPLCSLRLDTSSNNLFVEFINPDMRKVGASEVSEGDWSAVSLPLAGYNLEFFAPSDATSLLSGKFYARLNKNGSPSEPARFSLTPTGDIQMMGSTIGNFVPGASDFGLCTGVHKSSCSMFANGKGLQLIPNW